MAKEINNNKKILLLIGIISLMLVVACLVFVAKNKQLRHENTGDDVAKIVVDVHKMYANKANYWQLSTKSFFGNDILTKYRYKDNQLINTLGKPILVGRGENGDVVMPGEKSFDVVYTDLTVEECVSAAAYRFEQPENLGLLQITITNGEQSQTFAWGAEDHRLPISRVEAKRFCSNKAKVIWTFE